MRHTQHSAIYVVYSRQSTSLMYLSTIRPLIFTLFTLCLTAVDLAGQQDLTTYKRTSELMRQAINQGQPESVYQMTSESFRKRITLQQFATGMNRFKAKNGVWKTISFRTALRRGIDFNASFGLTEQVLSLTLDSSGKIERMNFQEIPFFANAKDFRVKDDNPLSTNTDRLVDSLVRPYIQLGHTAGLVLAIIKDGKVSTYCYGTTDKRSIILPDPERTLFEIGSVTKTFTSLLLAKQLAIGQMRLDDPINQYLPDSIPPLTYQGEAVRLVHLANHTSGFPRLPENIFNGNIDSKNPYLHYTIDSLFSYLKHYQVKRRPGTNFSYSNYGAGLLGILLEMKTGMSFDDLIKKDITWPLKMNSTFIEVPAERKKDVATGHNERGLATSPWDLASLKGSGAISSTLMDMVRYTQAQLTGKPELANAIAHSHRVTFLSEKQDMALGWRIQKVGKRQYLHHAGGTGGFRSFVGFDMEKHLGVVILSNTAEEVAPIGERLLRGLMK